MVFTTVVALDAYSDHTASNHTEPSASLCVSRPNTPVYRKY